MNFRLFKMALKHPSFADREPLETLILRREAKYPYVHAHMREGGSLVEDVYRTRIKGIGAACGGDSDPIKSGGK